MTRRNFLASLGASASAAALSGCTCPFCGGIRAKTALQLYSIRTYIKSVGLEKALADVAAIGYKGVEFAGYYGFKAPELRKMLADNGLVVCGTHISREAFSPEKIEATMDFEQEYGNTYLCCPGGGNRPPDVDWSKPVANGKTMDFMKEICDDYNKAAETAAKRGCQVGLHNHQWEFQLQLPCGGNYWDYFFSHTVAAVQMEQDVGWTTCAGFDPCAQYLKYPHRSRTLHAKENGMGKDVKEFDAILGQPGRPGAKPVDWNRLLPVTEKDGVEWYVVECEKHEDGLAAVTPSYQFLKEKGLN